MRNALCFTPHGLSFRGKTRFFRLGWAGRRCAAASRYAFFTGKRSLASARHSRLDSQAGEHGEYTGGMSMNER